MLSFYRNIFLILFSFILFGCGSYPPIPEKITRDIIKQNKKVDNYTKNIDNKYDNATSSYFSVQNNYWIGKPKKTNFRRSIPENKNKIISMIAVRPVSIEDIANRVFQVAGINVRLEEDVFKIRTSGAATPATDEETASEDIGGNNNDNAKAPVNTGSIEKAADKLSLEQQVLAGRNISFINITDQLATTYNFQGQLSNFLDIIASRFNLFWYYKNETIVFKRYLTHIFYLNVLPINSSLSSGVSGNAGGISQSASFSSSVDMFNTITSTVQNMLSSEGRLIINKSSGALIISDKPDNIEEVKDYINSENIYQTRQVVIRFFVLQYNRSYEKANSVNITNLVGKILDEQFKYTLKTPGISELTQQGGMVLNLTKNENNKANPLNVLIQNLDKRNDVNLVRKATVSTLNNIPIPFNITTNKTYVKSIDVKTNNSTNETTVTVSPSEFNYGMSISILPKILHDDHLLMSINMGLSGLVKLEKIAFNRNEIQIPELTDRSFVYNIKLRSNNVLMLTGFETFDNSSTRNRPFDVPYNLLGGNTAERKMKSSLIMFVQPILIGEQETNKYSINPNNLIINN